MSNVTISCDLFSQLKLFYISWNLISPVEKNFPPNLFLLFTKTKSFMKDWRTAKPEGEARAGIESLFTLRTISWHLKG